MKNLKASIALALGYLLLYAGIHDGGNYALSPWAVLSS